MAYDFNSVRNPILKAVLEAIFNTASGHDHDGVNSKAVSAGTPADGSVTNAKVAAGIDAAKLGDGSVSNTEFQYLNGVTSNIQAQINGIATAQVPEGTPVNAVAATKTLTLAGVAIDGEKVTIGADVYEFCADAAQSLTAGSDFAVDITASVTASAGTLTVDTQPTAGDTMLIGSKTYTFVTAALANDDGLVSRGTDLATAQAAIVAAINGADGHNTAHPQVSAAAFGGNASVITAKVGGVAGDAIVTTETFTAGTNVFDAGTLGTTVAGVDCTAPNAVTALVASITANDTQGVGAVDGAGDTVVLTADTKGVAGNSIAISETMANGSFAGGAVALSGGVDGTVGTNNQMYADSTYLYLCIGANTIADANWRRVSLGAAY